MRKEDYEVEAQLEKSIAARSKWKGVMEQKMVCIHVGKMVSL